MIKKPNEPVSFMFGDIQLLHIIILLGANSYLNFRLKTYKTSETKGCFPYELFVDSEKLNITQCPPYETFFSKLSKNNPFEKDYLKIGSSKGEGMASKEAFWNLKLIQPPAIGQENYQYLTSVATRKHVYLQRPFAVV